MYSMLSTPEAASDVFFDPRDGVLAGLSEGKRLVDCATLQVEVRANAWKLRYTTTGDFPAVLGAMLHVCFFDLLT